ncbi:MAG TPA: hypothetical protein VFE51_06535 [Verrucomicrobiae bacterium]|nr:hypothetical protein [Verrucomicrobiae bacterium]
MAGGVFCWWRLFQKEEPETILFNGNIWTVDEAQPRAQAVAIQKEEPETISFNGNIWTVDEAQPRAQAVAISRGRFVTVGSNEEMLR